MKDNVQSKLSYLNFNITTKDEVMCDSESIEEFDHMVVEIKKKKKKWMKFEIYGNCKA